MPMFLFLRRLRHSPAAFCGLIIILLLMLIALFAPWLAPHDPNWQDAAARLQAPSRQHWLGTDSYGRDLLSRLIYGSRPALGLVALVTIITLPVGLLIGILAGYYGGCWSGFSWAWCSPANGGMGSHDRRRYAGHF